MGFRENPLLSYIHRANTKEEEFSVNEPLSGMLLIDIL